MSKVIIADANNFDELIKTGKVLVDFYAEWCGPCKMLSPILEKISEEKEDLKIVKIDVDEYPEIAGKYDVMAMPTMLLFRDGQVVDQKVGFSDESALISWIDSK